MTLIAPELWTPQGVETLEARAWEALRETSHSVCVTAGAGAGKTEFLAQKATYLLQTGICPPPMRILAISFKRDAARTLAERVAKRCPSDQARRFDSLTFDAFTKGFVDRFRAAIPLPFSPPPTYRIDFPKKNELQDFLETHSFLGTNVQQLERQVAGRRVPFWKQCPEFVRAYWRRQYTERDQVMLSFAMINRLVDCLLRKNPRIRRALQATYPFVFLDEFQDTTFAQFDLLHSAFDGSGVVFTAVGDDKQRIMGWAGALSDAFDRFAADFDAERLALLSNWRSHEDLVLIQHVIARMIDPASELPSAQAEREVDGDIAAIWEYESEPEEADGLASWIAAEIEAGIEPHEFAILVRSHANDAEGELGETFARHSVELRNVARNVGEIAIQDLLGEELTKILVALLRLGATTRSPECWTAAQRSMQLVEGIYPDDDIGQQKIQDQLEEFVRELRSEMRATAPEPESARRFAELALEFIGEATLRRAIPAYQRQIDFERVWNGFSQFLSESVEGAGTWSDVLGRFEGWGQVSLMTIHKSKGLEFHTMIFYGFDSETWWSLRQQRDEEINSFFVAFTRAKQRAFFTRCRSRGGRVAWIEDLLAPTGLNGIEGPA